MCVEYLSIIQISDNLWLALLICSAYLYVPWENGGRICLYDVNCRFMAIHWVGVEYSLFIKNDSTVMGWNCQYFCHSQRFPMNFAQSNHKKWFQWYKLNEFRHLNLDQNSLPKISSVFTHPISMSNGCLIVDFKNQCHMQLRKIFDFLLYV